MAISIICDRCQTTVGVGDAYGRGVPLRDRPWGMPYQGFVIDDDEDRRTWPLLISLNTDNEEVAICGACVLALLRKVVGELSGDDDGDPDVQSVRAEPDVPAAGADERAEVTGTLTLVPDPEGGNLGNLGHLHYTARGNSWFPIDAYGTCFYCGPGGGSGADGGS